VQCGGDFDAYEIVWIVEATVASLVNSIKPPGTDDCEENVSTRYLVCEALDEIRTKGDAVYVHEDAVASQFQS
jgi:hypothetical protein